jgi:uncharacterized HAD superfamily protein
VAAAHIYVDLDDVLCQTTRALTELHAERTGRRLRIDDIHCFDLRISLGLDAREYESFMRAAHAPEFLGGMEPVPGAAQHLADWGRQGYQVSVLTGRPPSCEPCTRRWLAAHGLPHQGLHMVDKYGRPDWHGSAGPAMTLAELAGLRYELALEDSLPMAAFLAELGIPVLLLDRPWNRDTASLPADASVTRIADLDEASRIVRGLRAAG